MACLAHTLEPSLPSLREPLPDRFSSGVGSKQFPSPSRTMPPLFPRMKVPTFPPTRSALPAHALVLLLPVLLLTSIPARAQRGDLSAREAVRLVSSQFGADTTSWIAEIHGEGGTPQPSDWSILASNPRAPQLLHSYWAGGGRARDNGPDQDRYPMDLPTGYFRIDQVSVDSVAAFTIAEGEARSARIGFDSCSYLLRMREFSNEPLWRLELFDGRRQLVGKVYLSATNGRVYRTAWVYREENARPDGLPRIVDSALSNSAGSMPQPSEDYTYRAPRSASPPVPGSAPPGMQPFQPVSPGDLERDGSVDLGIPDPPAPAPSSSDPVMTDDIPPPPPPSGRPAEGSGESGTPIDNGTGSQPTFPDMRDPEASQPQPDPTKPPVDTDGSSTSDGRIPPPPLPPAP